MKYLIVAGALCAGLLASAAQAAEGSKSDNTQMCVRLLTIIDEWVIDDQTIVINQGGGMYKRVDITPPCPSLRTGARRVTYDTPNHEFCAADQIRTGGPNGPLCVIKQITSISAAEAKELKTKIY